MLRVPCEGCNVRRDERERLQPEPFASHEGNPKKADIEQNDIHGESDRAFVAGADRKRRCEAARPSDQRHWKRLVTHRYDEGNDRDERHESVSRREVHEMIPGESAVGGNVERAETCHHAGGDAKRGADPIFVPRIFEKRTDPDYEDDCADDVEQPAAREKLPVDRARRSRRRPSLRSRYRSYRLGELRLRIGDRLGELRLRIGDRLGELRLRNGLRRRFVRPFGFSLRGELGGEPCLQFGHARGRGLGSRRAADDARAGAWSRDCVDPSGLGQLCFETAETSIEIPEPDERGPKSDEHDNKQDQEEKIHDDPQCSYLKYSVTARRGRP